MSGRKQTISFRATRVVNEPTKISFKTRDGKSVSFKAVKAVEKPVVVNFKSKKK